MSGANWEVEQLRGSATGFHERAVPEPPVASLWWLDFDRPAVVLGSTQPREIIDADAARHADVEVVRRRSGGGAVHLIPGAVTWVDVVLPADDPRWVSDIGRSFHWLGDVWVDVLVDLGVDGAVVHRGPLVRSRWSPLVCFAGLGPGEVTVGGRKVVGMAQRRTRSWARFQCALVHQWNPDGLVDLLALEPRDREAARFALADVAVGIDDLAPGRGAPADGWSPAVVGALERRLAALVG